MPRLLLEKSIKNSVVFSRCSGNELYYGNESSLILLQLFRLKKQKKHDPRLVLCALVQKDIPLIGYVGYILKGCVDQRETSRPPRAPGSSIASIPEGNQTVAARLLAAGGGARWRWWSMDHDMCMGCPKIVGRREDRKVRRWLG